ncbi:MAG: 3-oxoadipyl-CoA thiolase [Pseudomonadota bacterium]
MNPPRDAFVCDAIRTPIGRYGGALSTVRTDDLAAVPLAALLERNPSLDPAAVEDVIMGCANQAGEDNRNVARMATLLAGLPESVPGVTVNRLCGSGLNAVAMIAQSIQCGMIELGIAAGVESMSRSPMVLSKATAPFDRGQQMFDTTLGWRFINRRLKDQYGVDSMAETAENVADDFKISREDQDQFALRSQQKAGAAISAGHLAGEICPVTIPQRRGEPVIVDTDEHPRPETDLAALNRLKPFVRADGSITAGNASGINDGACALLLASAEGAEAQGLKVMARVVSAASTGLAPRIMGVGPIEASRKALKLAGLSVSDMDVVELNEAFAAQGLAVLRALGIPDDAENVNRWGGAIALGHPLGMSGARLVTTAARQLQASGGRYALCTMCIGVGQGIALVLEAT